MGISVGSRDWFYKPLAIASSIAIHATFSMGCVEIFQLLLDQLIDHINHIGKGTNFCDLIFYNFYHPYQCKQCSV